jgi:hypothetical protein
MIKRRSGCLERATNLYSGSSGVSLSTLLTVFLLLLPYTVSFGGSGTNFTLINGTSRYLHAVINGQQYLYIAPSARVDYESGSLTGVTADVAYSPGQGIKGKATKSFAVSIQTVGGEASTCSSNNSGHANTCSSSTEASTTTTVGPISWTVLPADLR